MQSSRESVRVGPCVLLLGVETLILHLSICPAGYEHLQETQERVSHQRFVITLDAQILALPVAKAVPLDHIHCRAA